MVKKKEARHAVRAALDSWNWRAPASLEPLLDESSGVATRAARVRTEHSTTVFSAEAEDWVRYLGLSHGERYEPDFRVRIHLHREWHLLAFEAENDDSRWLAELLERGLSSVKKRLESRPHLLSAFDDLVFQNAKHGGTVTVVLSPDVPSDGTREGSREEGTPGDLRVVLHSGLVRYVKETLDAGALVPAEPRLGYYWPLIGRLVSELAYPVAPLDRFAAKIDVFSRVTYVAIGVLYDGRRGGQLSPSPAGAIYERLVSESSGIERARLFERHPYFRMLSRLSFLLRGQAYKGYADDVNMAVREYLDGLYLRLSLAGAMPGVSPAMRGMTFERKGRKVLTPKPEIGKYGVHDEDDLESWKKVGNSFRELGFTLIRQLGMGEFGRVYEALNDHNPDYPARVALKVDRIVGKKKQAILEAEQAMHVGRELARGHHLMRLYDTGKLPGERFTYHVLQLIDGDTLDNLVGVTGTEHGSVSRPPSARSSELEAKEEYERAVSSRSSELWRSTRIARPFAHQLSPAMILDLLTSVLLWLEDVHRINYAINDLKNGNLMMSRRGQLKGIDLDSYAPVHSPKDKVTDFMFLAVSLVLLLLSTKTMDRRRRPWEEIIENESRLRAGLRENWPFGDVALTSDGRVSEEELMNVLVDLVQRSRRLVYAKRPDLFSEDIDRLIGVKRRLIVEELVID
jgi:hypothetical protein